MPRKKQVIQKQRRRKAYQADMSGAASAIKPKGAFRAFSNYKLFAIIGAIALAGSLGFSAFYSSRAGSRTKGSVRGSEVQRTTAEASGTSVPHEAVKQYPAPPPITIDENKGYIATIKTEKGDVKVQLLAKEAKETVNNFVFLANDHFYDNITFHRVVPNFVAQAGDPTGTGSGGPGYTLPVEKTQEQFAAGVLAMAKPNNAGEENNGSQFFITLTDEPTLTGTVFGKVIEGMDVLRRLSERVPEQSPELPAGDKIDAIEIQVL